MKWTPERIKALRKHVGLSQPAFGVQIGYASAGAQVRVSDLERGIYSPGGAVQMLLDIVAERHGFDPESEEQK